MKRFSRVKHYLATLGQALLNRLPEPHDRLTPDDARRAGLIVATDAREVTLHGARVPTAAYPSQYHCRYCTQAIAYDLTGPMLVWRDSTGSVCCLMSGEAAFHTPSLELTCRSCIGMAVPESGYGVLVPIACPLCGDEYQVFLDHHHHATEQLNRRPRASLASLVGVTEQ